MDCSFDTSNCAMPSGGGGGGGAWVYSSPVSAINLSGRAYPGSAVTLMRDAQIAAVTIAGPDANFMIGIHDLAPGNYIFSLFAEDKKGIRSSLYAFPVLLTAGVQSKIDGVFLSPTLGTNKSAVKRGDVVTLFGQAAPQSQITITVNSEIEKFIKVNADPIGAYLYNLDTAELELGDHTAKARAALSGEISGQSKLVSFTISSSTIKQVASSSEDPRLPDGRTCATLKSGNFNCDKKINLVDFSIWLFWNRKPNPPKYLDLNKNGKLDLADFSIFLYNWTG